MRLILFLSFFVLSARADKISELRARLTSGVPEAEEIALREIPSTPGSEELLEEIVAVAERRARPPGPVDLVERAIDAAASTRPRDPQSAAAALFAIASVSSLRAPPSVWHRAMRQFLLCGEDAAVIVNDAMISENPNTRVLAMRLLAAAGKESLPSVRVALASGLTDPHLDVVNAAAETLRELLESGVEDKALEPLFSDVVEALEGETRELRKMSRYSRGTTAAPALAEVLVRLRPKDPAVAPLLQKLLGELRSKNALASEQQEFVDLLNVARGKPKRGVSDETYARDELEKILRDRPARVRFSSRVVDKADAQAAVRALTHLDAAERDEYADRLASVPGKKHRYFRLRFVAGLESSSDPEMRKILDRVVSCQLVLSKLHELRRRRGR